MSENRQFFPADHIEALAFLFAEKASGPAPSPEHLCQKYWEAYYRIKAADDVTAQKAKANTPE